MLVISGLGLGGAERQIIYLANGLVEKGFEVVLVSMVRHVPLAPGLNPGVQLQVCDSIKFRFTSMFFLIRNILKHKPDICQSFLLINDIAVRLGRVFRPQMKVISSERNSNYTMKSWHKWMLRLTNPLVDACISNSIAGKTFHRTTTWLADSRYHVVPNGIDTERFQPGESADLHREHNIPEERRLVGMVASFKPQKNHIFLLRAALTFMTRQIHGIHFIFIGDEIKNVNNQSSEQKERVRDFVNENRLSSICQFIGTVEEMEKIYNGLDVLVLPSRHEGFPNVVLEAMSCAKPVIVTDVADNRHLVRDGVDGYVVPLDDVDALADRISRLHTNVELARSMGQNARRRILDSYSIDKMVDRTIGVYANLLSVEPISQRETAACM